jgi:hypothetical protein
MRRRRRRLPRILLNAATAVSLVLCAATVALWVRSYFVADIVERGTWERADELRLTRGAVVVAFQTSGHPHPGLRHLRDAPGTVANTAAEMGDSPGWRLCGFEYSPDVNLIAFPIWPLAVATSLLPLGRATRGRRTERAADACPACGYDLRATPARCPECGAAPVPPANS